MEYWREATYFQKLYKNKILFLKAVPSKMLGSLTSNGVVFLINPNGILVDSGGQIDVNGLVASTLDIDNGTFLRGEDLLFSGDSKSAVENF